MLLVWWFLNVAGRAFNVSQVLVGWTWMIIRVLRVRIVQSLFLKYYPEQSPLLPSLLKVFCLGSWSELCPPAEAGHEWGVWSIPRLGRPQNSRHVTHVWQRSEWRYNTSRKCRNFTSNNCGISCRTVGREIAGSGIVVLSEDFIADKPLNFRWRILV